MDKHGIAVSVVSSANPWIALVETAEATALVAYRVLMVPAQAMG